jgi:hypothetical protein
LQIFCFAPVLDRSDTIEHDESTGMEMKEREKQLHRDQLAPIPYSLPQSADRDG